MYLQRMPSAIVQETILLYLEPITKSQLFAGRIRDNIVSTRNGILKYENDFYSISDKRKNEEDIYFNLFYFISVFLDMAEGCATLNFNLGNYCRI